MVRPSESPRFRRIGGRLCLDLLNTVDGARGGTCGELLPDFESLLTFVAEAGLLEADAAEDLRAQAGEHERAAKRVLRRAIDMREALYAILAAALAGEPPPAAAVELLNHEVSAAMSHARLRPDGGGWAWTFDPGDRSLECLLWPLAFDAADLLTSPEHERVRECGGGDCTWMFVDTTKNHRRRWCQMEVCGNRAKARRHRARSKSAPRKPRKPREAP